MAVYCAVKSLQPNKERLEAVERLICFIVEGWKREIMPKKTPGGDFEFVMTI
jgi:hypothetical protein